MIPYEEALEAASSRSDHSKRVIELELAIKESLANTDPSFPTLEIGVRDGGSSILTMWWVANEGKGRKMFAVDQDGEPPAFKEWKERLGVNDTFVKSVQADFVASDKTAWGFIYLDADHDMYTVTRDIKLLAPRLAKGCIVAVDDVHGWKELPDMTEFGLERVQYDIEQGPQLNDTHKQHVLFLRKFNNPNST